MCGTLFCPSLTTCANAWHYLFNTQYFCIITTRFAAVRFRLGAPTCGVVTNTEGCHESWNLRFVFHCSSLKLSAYIRNVATWSAKYLVNHYFESETWPRRRQNYTILCERSALVSATWLLSCIWSSASLNASLWSGSSYSVNSSTSSGGNPSHSHGKIGESTEVSSGHSLNLCLEMFLGWCISSDIDKQCASH